MFVAGSCRAMKIERTSNSWRTRSPTSSMMASKSSCRRRASPTSLMTASSAARSVGLGQEALGLVEEPCVLEGDTQARGQRREQVDVAVAEGRLAVEVLERDDAGRPARRDERHEDRRLRAPGAFLDVPWEAHRLSPGADVAIELERLAALHHERPVVTGGLLRVVREALPVLDNVRVVQHPVRPIDDRDVDDLGVEDGPDLARPRARTSPACRVARRGRAGRR